MLLQLQALGVAAAGSPPASTGSPAEAGASTEAMAWLDDTEWLWNEWSNVQLEKGGTFVSSNCVDVEQCRWWTSGDTLRIRWADAGTHTLTPSSNDAKATTSLRGVRDLDSDPCAATFVRKGIRVLGMRMPPAVEQLAPHFFHGASDLQLTLIMTGLGLLLLIAIGCGCCANSQAEDDAAVLRRLSRSRGQLRACAVHLHSEELEKLAVQLQQIKAEIARDDAADDESTATAGGSVAAPPIDCGNLAWLASWVLPGVVFYLSAAPDVCLVDAGALTLAAALPGVAHPPGFPLWTMCGWVSSLFPGRVIRNVNLLSAVSATLLCHLIWRLSRRWVLAGIARPGSQSSSSSVGSAGSSGGGCFWLVELGPLCGAMLAGLSFPVWGFATFAEVYHITSSGLVAAILVTCAWRDRLGPADDRIIALGGLLFGLGACAHHITAALALPALIYLAATRPTNGLQQSEAANASEAAAAGISRAAYCCQALRNVCIAAAAAIIPGVVCYGWLFYIGSGHPLWNWGGVDDLEKLWWHISGKQYQVNFGQFRIEGLWLEAGRIGWLALTSWTPLGLVIAWWGLGTMRGGSNNSSGGHGHRLDAEYGTLMILLVLSVCFAFCYEIAEDKEGYYVTASWVIGLAFGLGASDLLQRAVLSRSKLLMAATALLVLSVPLSVGVLNEGGCDRSTDIRGPSFVADIIAPIEEGGLLLTQEWQFYAPWLALHHLDGYRPDLKIIDVNLVRRFWYLDYLEVHVPDYMAALRPEVDRYKSQLYLFDHELPYETEEIHGAFIALLNGFVRVHQQGSGLDTAYIMTPMEDGVGADQQWEPRGLVYNVRTTAWPEGEKRPTVKVEEEKTRWVRHAWDIEGYKLHSTYLRAFEQAAQTADQAGEKKRARKLRRRAAPLQAQAAPFNV